ncbi:MAG: alginate lyase family protein [Gaiellaceae bacterium]
MLGTLAVVLALVVPLGVSCSASESEGADAERTTSEQTSAPETETEEAPPPDTVPRLSHEIWISEEDLVRLPTGGPAWERVKAAADETSGSADIANQDSNHDAKTLARALVYARTGDTSYRERAADGILDAIGTEEGGRTLELGRNLLSYVIAADVIDLREHDPEGEADFREWLRSVRNKPLGSEAVEGQTLVGTAERSPSNWGGMAGASRAAVAAYLGDEEDLARQATVMRGWLGDRSAYPGIPSTAFGREDVGKGHRFGGSEDDLSWHVDPSRPRGVNPEGAEKDGHSIDGALPDDMRRGGGFTWPPNYTQYPREALSGYVALAEILFRQGYDVYEWENRALLRATRFLWELEQDFPDSDWWEPGVPVYWIVNHRYDTSFPVTGSGFGRNVGWTDWTHAPS